MILLFILHLLTNYHLLIANLIPAIYDQMNFLSFKIT